MSKKSTPYLGKRGISSFFLHKSHIELWKTCKRAAFNSIMHVDRSTPDGVITEAGTSFHLACNRFFDNVDLNRIVSMDASTRLNYFKDILETLPENRELLYRFAQFENDRFEAFRNNPVRWFPCNRELEIIKPKIGLWGTIDSVEYVYDDPDSEERAVVEYKTGRLTDWRKTKLRRELAVYKLLIDDTPMAPVPIKYIGAFCAGNEDYRDGIMFEKVNGQTLTALLKVIKEIRETFEKAYIGDRKYDLSYFPKEASAFCMLCSYSERCYEEESI